MTTVQKVHPIDALKRSLGRYAALQRVFKGFAAETEAANDAGLWSASPLSADGQSFEIAFAGRRLRCIFSARLLQDTGGELQFFLCDRDEGKKLHPLGATAFDANGQTSLKHFADSERADPNPINVKSDAGVRELVAHYILLALEVAQ